MRVVGKNFPSKRTIEALIQDVDTESILSWGTIYNGAVNGMPRVYGYDQLYKMRQAGVVVPDFTRDRNEAATWLAQGCTVLGRREDHSQGRAIVILLPGSHFYDNRSEYWTKFVRDVDSEWRINVFKGRYIAQGKKVAMCPTDRAVPIRSRSQGWRIIHTEFPERFVRDAAVKAVVAVGYDFGAVDVLVAQGRAVVLEVNKAPGLDNYTATKYAEAINNVFGNNGD